MIGIAQVYDADLCITAGAVVGGSFFGDKMSPLSDTTNLAPAMAGTDLFTHIRYMVLTTGPSIIITLIIFLIIGFTNKIDASATDVDAVLEAITTKFNVTPLLLLVPAFLIFIIVKKIAPLPALLAGTLAAYEAEFRRAAGLLERIVLAYYDRSFLDVVLAPKEPRHERHRRAIIALLSGAVFEPVHPDALAIAERLPQVARYLRTRAAGEARTG